MTRLTQASINSVVVFSCIRLKTLLDLEVQQANITSKLVSHPRQTIISAYLTLASFCFFFLPN